MKERKDWRSLAYGANQSVFLLCWFRLWLAKSKNSECVQEFGDSSLKMFKQWLPFCRNVNEGKLVLCGVFVSPRVLLCHPTLSTQLQTSTEALSNLHDVRAHWLSVQHVSICQELGCSVVKVTVRLLMNQLKFPSDICGDCVHEWV